MQNVSLVDRNGRPLSLSRSDWLQNRRDESAWPTQNAKNTGSLYNTDSDTTDKANAGDGGVLTAYSMTVPLGRLYVVHTLHVWSDTPMAAQLTIQGGPPAGTPTNATTGYYAATGTSGQGDKVGAYGINGYAGLNLDMRDLALREFETILVQPIQPSATGVYVGGDAMITSCTNDPHWDAGWVEWWIGDSTMWTVNGTTTDFTQMNTARGDHLASFRVSRALRAGGADLRHVNSGFGGATCDSLLIKLRQGRGGSIPYNSVHLQIGMNDSGLSKAAYKSKVEEVVQIVRGHRPDCWVWLHDVPPTDIAGFTASGGLLKAQFKAALQELSAAYGKCVFVPTGDAYLGTDQAYFGATAEQSAGTRIHPNQAGHGLLADAALAAANATPRYLLDLGIAGATAAPIVG